MNGSALSRRVALMLLLGLIAVPALWSQAPDKEKDNRRAIVNVRVYADATLTVDDKATHQTGERRTFQSPPLEAGKKYTYTFVAKWLPRNNYETYKVTRKVTVEAGKTVEIDMSEPKFDQGDTLQIMWVATPPEVIDAMMKLAKVGKDDVVYDLGCGRGEIVIAAAKKFNAKRAVGIDIEKDQVQKAKEAAKKAGVEDRVEIREGDALKVKDLSEATVVTIYMSEEFNKLLMPILQKQLKPGARIVTHRFTMGDRWKPDKKETVDITHDIPEEKDIYLWTIKK
ncbi:MAG TPA: TIGR03000 domain-containing protein [Gemmataceae bacterium]|nr:TIGR03000 domain-containing protein [Gemmataceae bacterium]